MDKLNDSADIFANSSTDTVTENMDFSSFIRQGGDMVKINNNCALKFHNHDYANMNLSLGALSPLAASSPCFSTNSANISFVTNQFVSEACNASLQLYCPFCLDEFKLEFLLKEHIKATHPHELKNVVRLKSGEVEFNACPFCHAKYYTRDLLPKHIVRKHQESALAMFPETNPDKFAYCPFCSHKVLLRHSKMLILHIEKKHLTEFQHAVKTKCASVMMNSNDLKTLDYDRRNEGGCSTLSKKMKALTTNVSPDTVESARKSILKKTTSYPEGLNENEESKTMNNNQLSTFSLNNSSTMLRRSARRRLRFELPESSSSGSSFNKENSSMFNTSKRENFSPKKEKKLRWKNLFRFDGKKKNKKEAKESKKKPEKSKDLKAKKQSKFVTYSSESSSPKKGNKKVQTTPVYSTISWNAPGAAIETATSQFKCGLCYETFNKNAQLLEHIRKSHKGLKLVPQYLCGHCDAKFYRNTFLVRHCWYHHTPHCLKTGTTDT
ncbi:hypothetical protein LSTR_LSTR013153 [Laodelphax striatellus]|uniref:C2H2-type domain-containing protein n=1 Tax=Laodelphax striatellus TaxID=195883 RepID=A0A482WSY6_LAOST|nr:hypothetical protein LSTR_LSTR013153 [Laodelphax striatellus]